MPQHTDELNEWRAWWAFTWDRLETKAQAAASLRQRLEELERACANHCATENRLTAQLEQAQKERDEAQAALVKLTADIPKTEKRLEQTAAKANLRAVDAEAKCAQLVQDINERCREIHQLRDEAKFDPEVTFGWYREQLSRTEARASQAEAALEEMREWLMKAIEGASSHTSTTLRIVLAALQRRRSPTGQERNSDGV